MINVWGAVNTWSGKPVITVYAPKTIIVFKDALFAAPVATAMDAQDGDMSHLIEVVGAVDTSVVGNQSLTYRLTEADSNGNLADEIKINIIVVDYTNSIVRVNKWSAVKTIDVDVADDMVLEV